MRTSILIILAAFAMVTMVSAAYPVEVNVTSNHAWMVADNKDTATITATVIQGTGEFAGQPLEGANVSLAVDSPWQLKNTFLRTDKNGTATTTLLDTKKSGTANITVTAWAMIYTETWGYVNYTDTKTLSQPIDHNTPSSIVAFYNNKVQVRVPTLISVLVRDKYGNPVDNRNVVESVKFAASSTGVSGFLSGNSTVKSITVPVNASGYANVQYIADILGTNYIIIDPPSPILNKLISIEGLSLSAPSSATCVVSPSGVPYPYTIINTDKFTIGFTFRDQYGYPVLNQPINISTNIPGEEMSLLTNKYGMVVITYGPKDIAGVYNITARAAKNLSVSVSQKVEFINGAAADALLTASPQTMASRDVKDDITSTLTMRVMDMKGNPVAGETVKFRFKSFNVPALYNQTMGPVLEDGNTSTDKLNVWITAVSDENGEAVATFHPGAFTTDYYAPKYNASAVGTAIVEAQWSTKVTRQMTLKYLNYRYLTVESEVNPTTLRVNETVDLTVRVRGDGWALQPKPIDVMLVTDRSGSMLSDDPDDRMVSVKDAAKVFSDQLDYSRDRLGQVSFGGTGTPNPKNNEDCGIDGDSGDDATYAAFHYSTLVNYADYANLDQSLTSSKVLIDSKIATLAPNGYTPMRYAIFRAINETKNKWNPNSVRALIVLSDGDYNHYGDPLARSSSKGTTNTTTAYYSDLSSSWYQFSNSQLPSPSSTYQNMSNYAKYYNVKIFTIGFASGISSGGKLTLSLLANQTGGKYYDANAANIADVYKDIAGSLRDEAGVNTTLNLSFQNVVVGNITMPGNQVYSYQRIPGRSTRVITWNLTVNPLPGYPVEYNSTDDWNTDQKLDFYIGTIRLGQTWQSTVSFKVLKEGNINVFNASNSQINVENNGTLRLNIPEVFITALPNNSAVVLTGAAHLSVEGLGLTNAGSKTKADLKWNLVYDGIYPISEDIMIASSGTEDWYHLPQQVVSNLTTSDTASIPLDGYAYGYYIIRVDGDVYDANSDYDTLYILLDENGVSVAPPGFTPTPTPTPKPRIKIS